MITKLAHQFSDFLVSHGAEESQKEVYAYSMEFIINLFISDLLLLCTGLLLHQLPALIIWCISYTALRVNIGGYHASTHMRCIISGTFLGMSCLLQNWIWQKYPVLIPILLLSILLNIIFLAPAVYERHPVSDRGKKTAKIRSSLIYFAGILLIALFWKSFPSLSYSFISGFVSATLLSVLLSIMNFRHFKAPETI